jgi:Aerotolerance regulator N-terminal/von Willebrand factor type A domain
MLAAAGGGAVGLSLGAPLGLVALAALPVLVGAYFLRRRQPPRTVSALFLWRSPDQRAEAGPRLDRFSREVSLALESLAVVAAALFLADARCGGATEGGHLVVVVDGSLSMAARDAERSAADRAREALAALVAREHPAALTVVESGPRPSVLAGPQAPPSRALRALEAWRPVQPAHDLAPAFALARDLSTSATGRLRFLTDGPPEPGASWPAGVEVHSVGRPLANLAFLAAQRRDVGGQATVTLRVGNFSSRAVRVPLRFAGPEGFEHTAEVALDGGASSTVRVSLRTSGPLEVALPDDALDADSHLTLLPSPEREVTLTLEPGLDPVARAAVERVGATTPSVRLGPGGLLTVGPPGSAARVTVGATGPTRAFVGPFFAQRGSAVLDDVALGGVVWSAGASAPGRPLLSMDEVVLLAEDDDGRLHLDLELARSNVQRTVAWPVLWGNIVREARLAAPGFPFKQRVLGEAVPVVTAAGARWVLEGPSGQRRELPPVGATTLAALPPGRWALLRDGVELDALQVLAVDPLESDLRTRGPFDTPAAPAPPLLALAPSPERPAWPVALALLALVLDFWWTARAPARAAGSR